jgi:hypothetical protein
MAGDFPTLQSVLGALHGGGPAAHEPVVAGVEAAKRYIYAEAASRGSSAPYQGPSGLTPTPAELPALIDGLREWAVRNSSAIDTDPLLTFRHVDLNRQGKSAILCGSGSFLSWPPGQGEWERAAQRAVEALNELKSWALGLHERRNADCPVRWIMVSQAESLSNVNRGVISRAVDDGQILSNGQHGTSRRIDSADFNRWALERARNGERQESADQIMKKLKNVAEK